MRKSLLLSILFPFFLQAQNSSNITLSGTWDDATVIAEPNFGLRYNSVWGYSQGGREYAIMGSTKGTHIIEITNPANPVLRDFIPGKRGSCIWREYKTYNNYLYHVSDDASPNSLQIMDLSYLPDSVSLVYNSSSLVERAHTIFIDGNKMYLAVPKGGAGNFAMAVYSLANPAQPTLLRTLNQDYSNIGTVHDMFVRNDTIYASAANQGLHIYKLNSSFHFELLASYTTYPDAGYNHSSALTENGRVLVFADEVPANLKLKAIDVTDLTNVTLLDTFQSTGSATPHNPYIKGNDRVVVAYYKDGLQIFDISDPTNITRTGFYDTNPNNDGANPNYQGCWGAYIHLPSGRILASDMQKGLFILDATSALTIKTPEKHLPEPVVYPVPFGDMLNIDFEGRSTRNAVVSLYDMSGKLVLASEKENFKGTNRISLSTKDLSPGFYIMKLNDGEEEHNRKVIRY